METKISSKDRQFFRLYERSLFRNREEPRSERLYVFYLLLRPIILWLKDELVIRGLEPDEAESEIFLLADDIFKHFDTTKSSIIPYLMKAIMWRINKLRKKLDEQELKEEPYGLLKMPEEYYIDTECYLKPLEFIFEDRYLGKCFTNGEKYLIYIILTADDKSLNNTELARRANIGRKNIRRRFSNIKNVLMNGGYNERSN
jgi:DNA-binding phage protein